MSVVESAPDANSDIDRRGREVSCLLDPEVRRRRQHFQYLKGGRRGARRSLAYVTTRFRLRLLQHIHLAVLVAAVVKCSCACGGLSVRELAKAEVTVDDEDARPEAGSDGAERPIPKAGCSAQSAGAADGPSEVAWKIWTA